MSSFKIIYKVKSKLDLNAIEQSGSSGLFQLNEEGKLKKITIIFIACIGGVVFLVILGIVICVVVYRTRKKQLAIVDVIKEYDHVKN